MNIDNSFAAQVELGRTGLKVGRLGIGSSFGVPTSSVEAAFDRGCNYLYWGSIRRPSFGAAIRNIASHSRDKLVVALQSYARAPGLMTVFTELGLRRLRLDYADVLILGWYNSRPFQFTIDEALKLKRRGLVRHLALSSHNRPFFQQCLKEGLVDIFMLRYNAAHRGAEREVFNYLPDQNRPGVTAYTATRWSTLLDPRNIPAGERTPSGADCYRFALTHPKVDVVLSGPASAEHMNEAVRALELGPLTEEEMAWMRRIGDHVHASRSGPPLITPRAA